MDIPSTKHCLEAVLGPDGVFYVEIDRTAAFYLAMDSIDGMDVCGTHMGVDIHSKKLTLPGGNIERSDRNLRAAAGRETRQEFGPHIKYKSISKRPIVFLCDLYTDSWVKRPTPGQKVKLRVAFPVVSVDSSRLPRQQVRKPEVLNPRRYFLDMAILPFIQMRESSRIALTIANQRGLWPNPPIIKEQAPDLRLMYEDMIDLLVPPAVADYHCRGRTRRIFRPTSDERDIEAYLHRVDKASVKERLLIEADQKLLEQQNPGNPLNG